MNNKKLHNKQKVLKAVTQDGKSLRYASEKLRKSCYG